MVAQCLDYYERKEEQNKDRAAEFEINIVMGEQKRARAGLCVKMRD